VRSKGTSYKVIDTFSKRLQSLQKHYDSDPDASLEHELNQVGDVVKELESLAYDYVINDKESFDQFIEDKRIAVKVRIQCQYSWSWRHYLKQPNVNNSSFFTYICSVKYFSKILKKSKSSCSCHKYFKIV